ncbi:hypothetical protein OAS39_06430 [Pirellulales bacterium]|nr:hypothetical protein [Pirellulales bacterium]
MRVRTTCDDSGGFVARYKVVSISVCADADAVLQLIEWINRDESPLDGKLEKLPSDAAAPTGRVLGQPLAARFRVVGVLGSCKPAPPIFSVGRRDIGQRLTRAKVLH